LVYFCGFRERHYGILYISFENVYKVWSFVMWVRGWVCPRAGLEIMGKNLTSCPCGEVSYSPVVKSRGVFTILADFSRRHPVVLSIILKWNKIYLVKHNYYIYIVLVLPKTNKIYNSCVWVSIFYFILILYWLSYRCCISVLCHVLLEWSKWKDVCRDSSVGITTRYGLDGPGIAYRWVRDFPHTYPNRPWGPPTLLYNGYRVPFPGGVGKVAGGWRWPPTPSSADVKERVELKIYPPLDLRGLFYGDLYLYLYTWKVRWTGTQSAWDRRIVLLTTLGMDKPEGLEIDWGIRVT
jgi:hypothetical protein